MLLRKINAVISLIITFLLLDHSIFMGVWMLSNGSIPQNATMLPIMLLMLMMIHVVICIILVIRTHKGLEKGKYNGYSKQNVSTYIQRISGMLLIVFTILHVLGASGVMQPPIFIHAVVPVLFFALCLMHVSISASKAMITLGIGNVKFIKIVDITVKLICIATLLADVIGFYLYKV